MLTTDIDKVEIEVVARLNAMTKVAGATEATYTATLKDGRRSKGEIRVNAVLADMDVCRALLDAARHGRGVNFKAVSASHSHGDQIKTHMGRESDWQIDVAGTGVWTPAIPASLRDILLWRANTDSRISATAHNTLNSVLAAYIALPEGDDRVYFTGTYARCLLKDFEPNFPTVASSYANGACQSPADYFDVVCDLATARCRKEGDREELFERCQTRGNAALARIRGGESPEAAPQIVEAAQQGATL